MPPSDIEAISRMWTPLDEAPVSKSGKDFNRRIQAKVKFGFVPRQEAEAALRDQRMRMAFPDDPVMQQRFEVFLAAQAGHSKDWYLVRPPHLPSRGASLADALSHTDVLRAHRRVQPPRRIFSAAARRDAAKQL